MLNTEPIKLNFFRIGKISSQLSTFKIRTFPKQLSEKENPTHCLIFLPLLDVLESFWNGQHNENYT